MLKMIYIDDSKSAYNVSFKMIGEHIVELIGEIPVKKCGFMLTRPDMEDNWDYSDFTTIYHSKDNSVSFSNDGSVYTEPESSEPIEYTEEELNEMEKAAQVYTIRRQITGLKKQIEETDYQVIKTYEYSLVNKEAEYDTVQLHEERQLLRDKINILERKLSETISGNQLQE